MKSSAKTIDTAAKLLAMLALFVFICAIASCERNMERSAQATAEHPWELAGHPLSPQEEAELDTDSTGSGEFEIQPLDDGGKDGEVYIPPGVRWPELNRTDTLDPGIIPGDWKMVVMMRDEKMTILTPDQMTVYRFGEQNFQFLQAGTLDQVFTGQWLKAAPGVLQMSIEVEGKLADPVLVNTELFNNDFMFQWESTSKTSYWFARVQPEPQPLDENRWQSQQGEILLQSVVGNTYDGRVTGITDRAIRGYVSEGIISMRWEDTEANLGGYAMFISKDGWDNLIGVDWLDDYEAAPFRQPWNAWTQSN